MATDDTELTDKVGLKIRRGVTEWARRRTDESSTHVPVQFDPCYSCFPW